MRFDTSSTSSTMPEKPSKGPSVTFTFSPTSKRIRLRGATSTPPCPERFSIAFTSSSRMGMGLPWAPRNPVTRLIEFTR